MHFADVELLHFVVIAATALYWVVGLLTLNRRNGISAPQANASTGLQVPSPRAMAWTFPPTTVS